MKRTWNILKGTFTEFGQDNVMRLSAALAYYAMFSIGPLLVIVVGLAGFAFGQAKVRHEVQQQLQAMLGAQSAKTLDSMMAAQNHGSAGLITAIVGIVALLFGAAGVFGQLQDALNTIWGVTSKPGQGIWGFIRARFLSLTMVLGVGFLLLVSMALTTFLTAASGSLSHMLPMSETITHVLDFVVSFVVISGLFAMIFKFLPDVKVSFRAIWPGAVITALLFTVGKYLLALYLGRQSTASAYGAAGSVIIVLLWVYYASVILFFGAEWTQVHAKEARVKVLPTAYSVPVSDAQRGQQGMAPASKAPAGRRETIAFTPKAPALALSQQALGSREKSASPSKPAAASSARSSGGTNRVPAVRAWRWRFVGAMAATGFLGGLLVKRK